ncbi:roadblock/LC7 domain-containing protein [Nocardia aurea]|uniref:roadblock/LC7 domain-containing protein n=1 Tax=Nocardia aurea TaxID=2144174 RepID=UPI000D694561|nr:roadblock/LC7 domain-containing protein [Nocardia aurea]
MTPSASTDLDWLLEELVQRLPGVRNAVLLSTDGLLMARSSTITRNDAEHFCAMASALHGLARSAGGRFAGGSVRQAVIELDEAVMFVTTGGPNACLALWADESANMGMVAYEMNQTVQRLGTYLSAAKRHGEFSRVESRQ